MMYLFLSMILSGILGLALMMIDPVIGGIIAFAIVLGCIIRLLFLVQNIYTRLSKIMPKEDRVEEAYNQYLRDKNKAGE